MKIMVSVPVFARRSRSSRDETFTAAHGEDIEVTDAINRALEDVEDRQDEFVKAAARRVLEKSEW